MLDILLVYVYVIGHRLFGKMWKFCTISRTHRIYTAQIRFQIQELARCVPVHPLSLPVSKQPFRFKLFNGHVQVARNTLQVLEGIRWRHVPAAVGTGQAIHLRPYLHAYTFCHKI